MNIDIFLFARLATELFKADSIIKNAEKVMTAEQLQLWANENKICELQDVASDVNRKDTREEIFYSITYETPLGLCRQCGCTEYSACPGSCYWVEQDLCSACSSKQGGAK